MEITLKIDGEEKTFVTDFISARMFRKTLELNDVFEKGSTDPKDLDKLVDYTVDIFGKQFTRDQFYDGIESHKLLPTIIECRSEIVNGTNKALGVDDPNS